MKKAQLLHQINANLESGTITKKDLEQLLKNRAKADTAHGQSVSITDIVFYIAGVILFLTVMSALSTGWTVFGPLARVSLTLVFGLFLWLVARYLMSQDINSDIRKGLVNSLLLTGSLLLTTGGFILTYELLGEYSQQTILPFAVTLLFTGTIHLLFDKLIRRNILLNIGILLTTAAFPTALIGLLRETDATADIYITTVILGLGLLVYANRVVARLYTDRKKPATSFDAFASILGMLLVYINTFSDETGTLWNIILLGVVAGMFYISILTQNKLILGSSAVFMALGIISISVKYISGVNITLGFLIATISLLASAAVATHLNKKYFTE